MPQARCHTMEACLKRDWFSHFKKQKDSPLAIKEDVYESEMCDSNLKFYQNCNLWTKNPNHWDKNFRDLLRLCKKRSVRDHFTKVLTNPDLKFKCSPFKHQSHLGEKCGAVGDKKIKHAYCVTPEAPLCVGEKPDSTRGKCQLTALNSIATYNRNSATPVKPKKAWAEKYKNEIAAKNWKFFADCFPPNPITIENILDDGREDWQKAHPLTTKSLAQTDTVITLESPVPVATRPMALATPAPPL